MFRSADFSSLEVGLELRGLAVLLVKGGEYPLKKMALFGSVARGDTNDKSDVDILVEVEPTIGLRMVDLAEELESHLHRKVDLVSSRAIRSHMMDAIQEDLQYV